MTTRRSKHWGLPVITSSLVAVAVVAWVFWTSSACRAAISETAHNLLLDARVSGNIESLDKGLRGAPDHTIFDLQQGVFAKASQWHEYGVGFGAELGVVDEGRPAWWMAEWPQPVQVNLIALSGTYENQPQPATGWKIEFRRDGQWITHARRRRLV